MSFKIDFAVKNLVIEKPVAPTAPLLLPPKTSDVSFVAKRREAQFSGDNLRLKLEKQLADKITPFNPGDLEDIDKLPSSPTTLTGEELKQQQTEQTVRQAQLEMRRAANEETINNPDSSLWDKIKAGLDNGQVKTEADRLATESKITDEHLAAIERGDTRAVAFFDAMNQTNASGDPWDMNPGDAFRESLDPAAQKVYDETLAKLRNDPRIQFEIKPGAIDNLAFREIALRGLVAATFGHPADLEERIAQAADHSENGKYTITFVPDSYVGADGKTGWGARAGRDGIEAKQGFTVQQIANENDNLFIHEFSHTLEADADGSIDNLPNDFGFFNSLRFHNAFNTPEFKEYIGQTEIDAETFAGIQNRFLQNPQELKNVSPEMYAVMVEYSGFDPISGSLR